MASPRQRYIGIIRGGDVHLHGHIVQFRARADEVEERLNEALSHFELDKGLDILVVRYTQIRQFTITDYKPAGWVYQFESAPTGSDT